MDASAPPPLFFTMHFHFLDQARSSLDMPATGGHMHKFGIVPTSVSEILVPHTHIVNGRTTTGMANVSKVEGDKNHARATAQVGNNTITYDVPRHEMPFSDAAESVLSQFENGVFCFTDKSSIEVAG